MPTKQSLLNAAVIFSLAALFNFQARSAVAQSRTETLQAIAKLKGSEREARLRDGARKEGNLVWYSSTTAEDSLALNRKFEELYPFVKVQHLRAPSEKMIERILLESRAGSFKADLVALPEIELTVLTQRKLLLKHAGLEDEVFPSNVKDPAGYWTGIYVTAWVLAYNAKMVTAQTAPKTYADLLNPKWKRLMGMDTEPYSWFITSFRYLESRQGTAAATEYFKRLSSQELEWRKGHSLIGQLISAGEFPIGVEMQAGSVERLKAQGAPVHWVALDGVVPINNVGIAVTTAGTNTHAALLYYDFLLSRTGMEIMKARNRIPTRPDVTVPYLKPYKLLPFDAQVVDHFDRYINQFKDLLKPRG
ncbi:MAG: ABC transporter substrate-binding protein [Candidatus Binatia bacterium]